MIKFSDNTTIQVNNGTNGTPGATGPTGPTGPTGATGFTPVIGIDAQGYWTVIASNGGTATRIKDANGNYILAKIDNNNVSSANGYLTVNGVATTVVIPTIVFDEVNHVLVITIPDPDNNNTLTSYNVGLAEGYVPSNDIISLLSPIGTTTAIVSYGSVPTAANKAQVHPTPATADAAVAWAGLSYGQLIRSSGKVPVIVNPAAASIAGYTFEIIKQDGSLYKIQPSSITPGFTGNFDQIAFGVSSTTNGLYTLNLTPTLDDAITVSGTTTKELAIRAGKGSREILSGYQYSIKVQPDVTTTFALKSSLTPPVYIKIGTEKDLLSFFDRDLGSGTYRTLASTDFYKSESIIDPIPGNSDVENLIHTTAYSTKVSSDATTATVSNLNDKAVNFKIKTFDWVGKYTETSLNTVFYSALDNTINAIPVGTFTLTDASSPADQITVMLTPMFTQLDLVGKTELWRNQATNVKIENVPAGVSYRFLDAANTQIGSDNAILISAADVQAIRKVVFVFDETVAVPGTYSTMRLAFTDRRAYSTDVFKVSMPVTIVNPDMSTLLSTMAQKVPNLWNGQTLTVYGTGSAPIQGNSSQWYYNVNNAYVNLSAVDNPAAPKIDKDNWGFIWAATPTGSSITSVLTAKTKEQFNITSSNIYKTYSCDLYYYYFGNANNKVKIETINVTSKSEVKEGVVEAYVETTPHTPAILQITNGDLTSAPLKVSDYYRAKDYLGVNLNVFSTTRDPRIASVTLTNTSANSGLVNLQASGNDWTVQATSTVAELQVPYVDVPLTLTITDLLGQKLVGTVTVRVVKPSL